jgi:hypothetical protein
MLGQQINCYPNIKKARSLATGGNCEHKPMQSVLLDIHNFRIHGPELFIDLTYREVL